MRRSSSGWKRASWSAIEGNTNVAGSREGIGVFRRNGRKVLSIDKGFIDYGGALGS